MEADFLQHATNHPMDYANRILHLYPDVYKKIMPYIDHAVDSLGANHNLSEEQLNELTYQIIYDSNIMGQLPYGHNEATVGDIVKALLITAIFNRYHTDPPFFPFAFPYAFYPFSGFPFFPFGGFHGGFHGHGFRR